MVHTKGGRHILSVMARPRRGENPAGPNDRANHATWRAEFFAPPVMGRRRPVAGSLIQGDLFLEPNPGLKPWAILLCHFVAFTLSPIRPTVASRHKKPAINIDCLTRDITGIIGGQEGDEAGDIFRPADPLHGDIVNPFLHQFSWTVIAQQLSPGLIVISPHIGINDAGTECVHGDPRWGELFG